MKPARQGDLDGLCGLYALINAMELIAPKPPGPVNQKRLLMTLTESLSAKKLRKALLQGLDGKELIKAARAAFFEHNKTLGGDIHISRPFRKRAFRTNADYVAALDEAMKPGHTALILSFSTPRYSHWTVAEAVTESLIELRDSAATRSLSLERYTVRKGPYRILARETLVLQLRPRKNPQWRHDGY